MKKLLVAPWVGEFGWELFKWQGYLRNRIHKEEYDEIIVCCRPGHDFLYKDFCTEFIFYDPMTKETNMHLCDGDFSHLTFRRLSGWNLIMPFGIIRDEDEKQIFIPYGERMPGVRYDVLYHARSTIKKKTGWRNWSGEKWKELLSEFFPGFKIGAIGTKEDALHIEGTDDFRGIPLSKLADLMVGSSVLVGGSSGPMHFGSLCKISHITWAGAVHCKPRYEKAWNPFNTPVNFLADTWDPSVDKVREAIKEMLKK